MAAISHVFTIRRAAQILGRDEDLLWELSDQLEPEDGKLWVYDIDALKPPPSPTMASRLFAKLSRIRSIAPVNLKTSVPRCSAYAYLSPCRLCSNMTGIRSRSRSTTQPVREMAGSTSCSFNAFVCRWPSPLLVKSAST